MSIRFDYDALDEGIREVVRKCRRAGFETTDSGDGSKAETMACALPFKHVYMTTEPHRMVEDAHKLYEMFPHWHVETSYSPVDGIAVLMLMEAQ